MNLDEKSGQKFQSTNNIGSSFGLLNELSFFHLLNYSITQFAILCR
jgi:hypothetical protein